MHLVDQIREIESEIAELKSWMHDLRSAGYFHVAGPAGAECDQIQPMIEETERGIREQQRLIEIAREQLNG